MISDSVPATYVGAEKSRSEYLRPNSVIHFFNQDFHLLKTNQKFEARNYILARKTLFQNRA